MTTRSRRVAAGAAIVITSVLASTAVAGARGAPAQHRDGNRTYELTIQNLTTGQPFTPPVVAIHRGRANVFSVGSSASFGVKEVAENGNVPALVDELTGAPGVKAVAVAVSPGPGPLPAGNEITITIDAPASARLVSFVSMLICTNDGFTGVDALRLPRRVGQRVEAFSFAYDSGTEVNTEKFSDIVPPCQTLGPVDKGIPGTGTSNPALAEGGVIHHHPGIDGTIGDLTDAHSWRVNLPVSTIAITRTA